MCIGIRAQYAGNQNYTLFEDDFDVPGRTWDESSYYETTGKWRAYFKGSITHGTNEHQAYQRSQAVFDDTNDMMLLIADYVSDVDLTCEDLETPNNDCKIDTSYHIRFLSGALQSIDKSFLYGYFEIRCKLPVHKGAFPAFWLWGQCRPENVGCDEPHYEEIDIFEYSWGITVPNEYSYSDRLGDDRCYTMGMYYNTTGDSDSLTQKYSVARKNSRLPDNAPSMNDWNTWGCLWMPDKVEWYINDEMVNSYYDSDSIPHHDLYLMTNYAINNYVCNKTHDVYYHTGTDTMFVDYIRVYQPRWDCCSVMIDEQSDMDNYQHGIKSSVTIASNNNAPIVVDESKTIDIMASEYVAVNGPFQVDVGAKFSITMQKCP